MEAKEITIPISWVERLSEYIKKAEECLESYDDVKLMPVHGLIGYVQSLEIKK